MTELVAVSRSASVFDSSVAIGAVVSTMNKGLLFTAGWVLMLAWPNKS